MHWDLLFLVSCVLLTISFLQDLHFSNKNSLQLTCILRRLQVIYYAFHLISMTSLSKQDERLDQVTLCLLLLVVTLQSFGFSPTIVLTPCLVFAPLGLVLVLIRSQILTLSDCASLLLVLHGVVVIGFWIGVSFLDRYSDASVLIQNLASNPWLLFCDAKYQSILIDHGGYNVFCCVHLIRNHQALLCFGPRTWICFACFIAAYFLLLSSAFAIRKVSSLHLRHALQLYHPLPAPPPCLSPSLCCHATPHLTSLKEKGKGGKKGEEEKEEKEEKEEGERLKELRRIQVDWAVLKEAKSRILELYHVPDHPKSLDERRVKYLLQRVVELEEQREEFVSLFKEGERGIEPFVLALTENSQTFENFLLCYEYLLSSLPYDVLYPWRTSGKKNQFAGWGWGEALNVSIWVCNLGCAWMTLLRFLFKTGT